MAALLPAAEAAPAVPVVAPDDDRPLKFFGFWTPGVFFNGCAAFMKVTQKLFHLANLSLFTGAVLLGYVFYASWQHTMNWFKLVLFWCGGGAVAVFLLYHLFAHSTAAWQGKRMRRYSLLHRAACGLLLMLGLWAATRFSLNTYATWQLPALYWEPLGVEKTASGDFAVRLIVGNQRYHHTLAVQEVQLIALNEPLPRGKFLPVRLRADSLECALQRRPGHVPHFSFTPALPILPIEKRELQLLFPGSETPALFQINALYTEEGAIEPYTQTLAPYILLEPQQVRLLEFSELVSRARQPSHTTQSMFIHAIGRSRHAQALATLLELLPVNDMRIQNLVCEALAILGDARAAAALIALARKNKNPQAVRALGELPSQTTVDYLIEVLENHDEAFLRAEATEALGRTAVLTGEKFPQVIPALEATLRYGKSEDALVQREAILALARINETSAIPVILEYARQRHTGQALRNLLEVTAILGDKWLLPALGLWIQDWRGYNLDFNDLQLLLNYLVGTRRLDMVQVLIETLELESSPEAQALVVNALFQLTGKDFGELQHPVLNFATEKSNRQILLQWQRWWKEAQQDSAFREQVKPVG